LPALAGKPVLRQNEGVVKILAVSDQVVERIYALASNGSFRGVELILGCGDLPYTYLEYLVTLLNVPLFYVPGNHDPEFNPHSPETRAEGGSNLDLKMARYKGLSIAGFGGSVRYRPDGVNQYTQGEASWRAMQMLPRLLWNRLRYGRVLDILISHSPPFGIHDDDTQAHQGLHALNWLLRVARPRYHFHGHKHFYRNNLAASETNTGTTTIMNIFPYKLIDINHWTRQATGFQHYDR
jgi:Icc-related predicted phosphoesterase